MRALFTEFPEQENIWGVDDQWMVGSSLMVKPVTDEGVSTVELYLPGSSGWYDFYSLAAVAVASPNQRVKANAPLEVIPVFLRGGSVLPRKLRLRRSATLMYYDPLTLTIAPDGGGSAVGELYLDDEKTLAHEKSNAFALRQLEYSNGVLRCTAAVGSGNWAAPNTVERVILAGQAVAPSKVTVSARDQDGKEVVRELSFTYNQGTRVVVVKKPDVLATEDWHLKFHM